MRRRFAGATTLLALALAGCSTPTGGVDGGLNHEQALVREAVEFTPQAGTCQRFPFREEDTPTAKRVVPCTEDHYGETVHVGQFTDAAAALATPPTLNQATVDATSRSAQRTAFAECDRQAVVYLG